MGHIPRMNAAMKALGIEDGFLNVIVHQYVNLKEGEMVKMSTRRGEFTTLDELVEAVGVDSDRDTSSRCSILTLTCSLT